MTNELTFDQQNYVEELCGNLRKAMIEKLEAGRVPVDWKGLELRAWLVKEALEFGPTSWWADKKAFETEWLEARL